jgi:ArsR family metal-binding transcriptional regulator
MDTTKKFSIEIGVNDEGKFFMHRINDGFDSFELLGVLTYIINDIYAQMAGNFKPDIIKREIVDEN